MPQWKSGRYALDKARSQVRLYTYKAGLLSKLAHDLVLEAPDFSGHLDLDGESASFEMDIASAPIRVISDNISADQKVEVQTNIKKKVLDTSRHPTIKVRGSGKLAVGKGRQRASLTIASKTATESVELTVDETDDGAIRLRARFWIKQTSYGIKPFTAMMGTLKIKDEMELEGDLTLVAED